MSGSLCSLVEFVCYPLVEALCSSGGFPRVCMVEEHFFIVGTVILSNSSSIC